jgi:hypothetical protein
MKIVLLFMAMLLTGCTVMVEEALEEQFGGSIESDAMCQNIQVSCPYPQEYKEWLTPNNQVTCQCQS